MAKINQTPLHTMLSNFEREAFKTIYNDIVKSLVVFNENSLSNMSMETDWMVTVLDCNVGQLDAEKNGQTVDRVGYLVPASYKHLLKGPTKLNNINLSNILGWVVEILDSANQISGGIMDGNINSLENITGWLIRGDVGMTAINDSLMLRIMSYNVINLFFSHDDKLKNKLQDIVRELHENTVCGRMVLEQMQKSCNLESYTIDNYRAVVKYQNAYRQFYTPIAFSVTLAGEDENVDMTVVKRLMLRFGYLRRLEQDFNDTFETKEIKPFSWFYIRALEKLREKGDFSLEALRADVLGYEDIRNLYQVFELPEEFQKEHSQLKNEIIEEIENLESDLKNNGICDFMRTLM